jgi:AraC-like DNA-binding protein
MTAAMTAGRASLRPRLTAVLLFVALPFVLLPLIVLPFIAPHSRIACHQATIQFRGESRRTGGQSRHIMGGKPDNLRRRMQIRDIPPAGNLRTANIKSGIVASLVTRADELGVPCEPWFSGLRLQRSDFSGETLVYLSYRQACEIILRALRTLPGHGHGLVLGARQDVGHFGLVGLAMLTAPDFGEAIRLGIHYAPITSAMMELSLDALSLDAAGPDTIAVTARLRTSEPEIEPFLCEELFSSCLMLCRGLLGTAFRPLYVELAYPAPPHAADYAAAFDCDVIFDGTANRVLIERAWLATPMPAHNAESARQVLALCRKEMPSEQPSDEIVAAVERLLKLQLADAPRLVDIAAELHLTERTLRRHLSAAGTTYKTIHDRLRNESAQALLRDEALSIAQVGAEVGFRDAREFRRAFKRWTGHAPRELRRRNR